jgi:hypothetical protein
MLCSLGDAIPGVRPDKKKMLNGLKVFAAIPGGGFLLIFYFLLKLLLKYPQVCLSLHPLNRGVEQLVARRAHNPKVVGSSPASATKKGSEQIGAFFYFVKLRRRNSAIQL